MIKGKWSITPAMIKKLITVIDLNLLNNYIPAHGINTIIEVHYINVARLKEMISDAAVAVQEGLNITLDPSSYEKLSYVTTLDDFLLDDKNIPIHPKECLGQLYDPIDRLVNGLLNMENNTARFSYYTRTLSRVFLDVVALYDAAIKISKLSAN